MSVANEKSPAGGGVETPAERGGVLSTAPAQSRSMDSLRVKLWREANRDRYNARERERMRKKRAARKS